MTPATLTEVSVLAAVTQDRILSTRRKQALTTAVCHHDAITACLATKDGCCPGGCDGTSDADCSVCGNGAVELGETCDGNCPTSCDDNIDCTLDTSAGAAATCDFACINTAITSCVSGDSCCPAGCGAANDDDCTRVLVVSADVTYSNEVITNLQSSKRFRSVTLFNGTTGTPTLGDLLANDVAFVFTDDTFQNTVAVGDVLADYFDQGGRVVTAVFSRCSNLDLRGRFGDPAQGYIFLATGPQSQPVDSLGAILEPASPLVAGVTTLTAQSAFRCTGGVVNGGVVVARWTSAPDPLIVRGVVGGRNRVDLNLFPPSVAARSDFWAGDGLRIMTNALLFK